MHKCPLVQPPSQNRANFNGGWGCSGPCPAKSWMDHTRLCHLVPDRTWISQGWEREIIQNEMKQNRAMKFPSYPGHDSAEVIWIIFWKAMYISEYSGMVCKWTCPSGDASEHWGILGLITLCRALRGTSSSCFMEQETLPQTFVKSIVTHAKFKYFEFISL